jgi:hypothetical protein
LIVIAAEKNLQAQVVCSTRYEGGVWQGSLKAHRIATTPQKHFHVQLRELSVKCAVERRASPAPLDGQGNQNSIAGIYEFAVASSHRDIKFETW